MRTGGAYAQAGKDTLYDRADGAENMTVNILGTKYSAVVVSEEKEPRLKDCDGFCDETTKEIVVENY